MVLELEPLESDQENEHPATFEARKMKYSGPELRHSQRRQKADRRAELRFEPGKEDRRSKSDRRRGGTWSDIYSL